MTLLLQVGMWGIVNEVGGSETECLKGKRLGLCFGGKVRCEGYGERVVIETAA